VSGFNVVCQMGDYRLLAVGSRKMGEMSAKSWFYHFISMSSRGNGGGGEGNLRELDGV